MKIQIVKNTIPVGYSWQQGKTVEVPYALGMQLIEDGYGIHLEEEVKEEQDEVQASEPSKPARKSKRSKGAPKGDAQL